TFSWGRRTFRPKQFAVTQRSARQRSPLPSWPKADLMAFGDLTTLGDVKSWLQTGQNAFPATDDGLLTRLITAASQFIQTWLNRQIASQDWIETRDGLGNAFSPSEMRCQFAAFPVTAVNRVVVDGVMIPPIPPSTQSGSVLAGTFAAQPGYLFTPTQLVLRGYAV